MKKLITICAAALASAVIAADTDCGALVTTGNIADSAKVENLTGANAGKATITINNNSGTAQSVTVYNAATIDTALAGKASTGDLATAEANAQAAANAAYANATNNAAQTYVKKSGDTIAGVLYLDDDSTMVVGATRWGAPDSTIYSRHGFYDYPSGSSQSNMISLPHSGGTLALISDVASSTNSLWAAIPSWARAADKPSYNFSDIGNKPTTLSGYGITDAKISNDTITLGSNTITPVTTETDPVWTSEKSGYVPTSRKVAGIALSSDITLKNLSIVGPSTDTYNGSAAKSVNQVTQTLASTTQGGTTGKNLTLAVAATSLDMGAYYIKIGSDGKPHLMLRQ